MIANPNDRHPKHRMDRFSTSFSSIWPRHGAIRAAFGTIQAVTSCGPLRTVEQSPRKRESGSFHENRPLLLAIRELPPPDRCARLAQIGFGVFETAADTRYKYSGSSTNWSSRGSAGSRSEYLACGGAPVAANVRSGRSSEQIGRIGTGNSFLSQHPVRMHFGLGKSSDVESVEIYGPDGTVDRHTDCAVNRYHMAVPNN